MKVNVIVTSCSLIPCTDEDKAKLFSLGIGNVCSGDFKGVRNYKFHRKFFKLIACTWNCLSEEEQSFFTSPKGLRQTLQIAAGHCEKVYNLEKKVYQEQAKSIAFENMTEGEFNLMYKQIKEIIFGYVLKGKITENQFEEYLNNF